MIKKTILFVFCCFGESIIIKYQSGKTQVINLDEDANSIYSIQIKTNRSLNETSVNKAPTEKTDEAKNSNQPKTQETKSSSKTIDVGNGIKIRWVTPNPYGGDY